MDDLNSSKNLFSQRNDIPQQSLPQMTSDRIRALIYNGKLPPDTQLPSEMELAEMMSVSRGTIRVALNILKQQGFIWRRQGVGTFVTKQPELMNRLDMNLGVTDLIESFGLTPGSRKIEITLEPASKNLAEKLGISLGNNVVCIQRIRTANNKIVAATRDIFPQEITQHNTTLLSLDELRKLIDKEHSVYRVLENHFQTTIEYGIVLLSPIMADAELIEQFGLDDIEVGTVMLYLEQIDYDKDQHPIMLSYEYHMADTSKFSVYRRRR